MVWNISNTSIRNPERIQEGLQLFAREFQGNLDGRPAEQEFALRLYSSGIVTRSREDDNVSDVGRKWRSCFTQLGFASHKKYGRGDSGFGIQDFISNYPSLELSNRPYELTPVGKALTDADNLPTIQDIFMRQLVCYEVPSPVESSYRENEYKIKPFILLLQILSELNNNSLEGLNKFEIAAFIQSQRNHDNISQVINDIISYRNERSGVNGRTALRQYDTDFLKEVGNRIGTKYQTLRDYADVTARYTRMTGLLSLKGARVVLNEEKAEIINAILASEPTFIARDDPMEYLFQLYNGTLLSFENVQSIRREINLLCDNISVLDIALPEEVSSIDEIEDENELKRIQYVLENILQVSGEERFAQRQNEESEVEQIIEYCKAILKPNDYPHIEIVDRPAYFEWVIWRAYLAINHITIHPSETRRFSVDRDFLPTGVAPPRGPDMQFPFNNYELVVEVTLKKGSTQEAAEGEPVRRHVADIVLANPTTDVYGLFIAPEINNNTAETFRMGIWYQENDEPVYIKIVPLTTTQFLKIFNTFKINQFSPEQFKDLLVNCLAHSNANAPQWKNRIDSEVNRWISNINE